MEMTSSTTTPTADLMPLLNFTAADLETNRSGELSATQQSRLQALQTRLLYIGVGVFFGLALLATLFLFGGQTASSPVLMLLGFLITGLNAIVIGVLGRQWMRLNADLRGSSVDTIGGKLERVLRPTGRINNYVLRVEGSEFAVNKDTFKAFQHEASYRLYRTHHAGILLSAERA